MEPASPWLENLTLICPDCSAPFIFFAGEQAYFARKKFQPRVRCPSCAQKRKQAKAANRDDGDAPRSRPRTGP
jgi:hypothetical protein